MNEILGLVALCGLLAAAAAWPLSRWKRSWPNRKIALIAPLPFPLIFGLLCLFVFVRAALAPKEACGVDACAMAMAFSSLALFWATVGYGVGVAMAALVAKRWRR